jgi:CheY-like chemotaxis protein
VLITDLSLPGMDGVTLAGALRSQGRRMGLIALTGHSDLPDEAAALFDRVITKPADPDALAAAVQTLFR